MIGRINAIIDLQYGSTGKGLIAGYLAEKNNPDTLITAWAANAGHTYQNSSGRKFVHTMLANGIVSKRLKKIMIGPGSLLNLDSLKREIDECSDLTSGAKIFVHQNAAVIQQRHINEEDGPMTKIGSTKKGCGAAAIHRIRRNPDDMNTAEHLIKDHEVGSMVTVVTPSEYLGLLLDSKDIQIEGAQGFGLSMYHGFYPYCTSRDVSTAQLMADCGVPFDTVTKHSSCNFNVIGTARTYPIRVANRYDDSGNQIGYSGPCYDDQEETSFESLGQITELTTVTKLPRRIFTFSGKQIDFAVNYNGVGDIFLNFVNYCKSKSEVNSIINSINRTGARVRYLGFGPSYNQVYDLVFKNIEDINEYAAMEP